MGLGLILIFFGLVWGGVPTITILGMVFNDGAPFFVIFPMLIFTVIGTVIVVTGVKKVVLAVQLKALLHNGKDGYGNYISHSSNVRTNGVPIYYIVFTYTNDKGQVVQSKTESKYHAEEATYYSQVGKFKIKYSDKHAVISEPVDYAVLHKMRSQMVNSPTYTVGTSYPQYTVTSTSHGTVEKEVYYVCDYCGGTQNKPGKCNYCGANVSKGKK